MPPSPPILQVSHLPSAASFYAAITQPLGIHYLFTAPPSSPLALLHYGNPSTKQIIFSLTPSHTPRPAKIYLRAPSSKAVIDFQKLSEQASAGKELGISHKEGDAEEEVVCCAEDWDGNMIEAMYNSGDVILSEAEKEKRKVRNWQEEVAKSVDGSQAGSSGPGNLRRAETFPRVVTESRPEPPRRSSGGLGISKGTVIGTLLGAAAGAAFAYAMVRSESPEPVAIPMGSYYTPQPPSGSSYEHVVERVPARSVVSERGHARSVVSERGQYVKEEDVRPRYVERYTVVPTPAPRELETIKEGGSYISTRSRARTNKPESHYDRPLQILPAEPPRERSPGSHSHVSRRSHRSSGSSTSKREKGKKEGEESFHTARSSQSESTVKEGKARSTVYVAAPSHVSTRSKKGNDEERDKETVVKVSASRVSVRPSQIALPESVVEGSRSGRGKSGRSKLDGGERESRSGKSRSGRSRVEDGHTRYEDGGSRVSTRERSTREHRHKDRGDREREYETHGAERVELPESVIGGGEYEASVAPSDSVSSVGSKRERLRLVERMRMSANYVGR